MRAEERLMGLQKANGVHPTHGGDPQLVDPPISRPSTAPRPEDLGSLDPRGSNTQENMSRAENVPNGDLSNGRPRLLRSKSDFGPRQQNKQSDGDAQTEDSGDSSWRMRHGFETQFTSEEYLNLVDESLYIYYADKIHVTNGQPKAGDKPYPVPEWRMKDRLKTVSAVLALCLNIGTDPPDVIKTNPTARLECWIDPGISAAPGHTPVNQIGKALQTQYEQVSMRTRYKILLDPTVDETKKYCSTLRRNAKDERILFHYNGHGVPKPTPSGEIWVFNKSYTQYIPISLYDLQSWLGAPSLFVWDCANSGLIVQNFNKFVEKHEAENAEALAKDPNVQQLMNYSDCIHLVACGEKEVLPTNPNLPADIFTSSLTTPIEIAIRFFILQNPLPSGVTLSDAANIPGKVSDRRSPIGELNWIFTAITDTIAWNCLSKPLFKKLFRQDLMVAALFRNFLLAQRVMRVYHCHPFSHPAIPNTCDHPLWNNWDLAVEMILAQLPDLLAAQRKENNYEYQNSSFFAEQLTAFEVYLNSQAAVEQKVPEQLPVLLQVLLSQVHRVRALILLSKFLDLGPWAVHLALSIGIFPYVSKLLQSQAPELKAVMVFIWARILAVDQSCQTDLLKDSGYQYFLSILHPDFGIPMPHVSDHRAMCCFIIAMFCKGFHQGQVVSLSVELLESCIYHMDNMEKPLLRQWACLCTSNLWEDYPDAKWAGIRSSLHQKLCELVVDPVPEVRAAMLHALTTFLGIPDLTDQVAHIEASIAANVMIVTNDGNIIVRKELLVFFSTFIARYLNKFMVAAYEQLLEERESLQHPSSEDQSDEFNEPFMVKSRSRGINGNVQDSRSTIAQNTIFSNIWKQVLILSVDPQPEIARDASIIVDYVFQAMLYSPLAPLVQPVMKAISQHRQKKSSIRGAQEPIRTQTSNPQQSPPPAQPKHEGTLALGVMRRTASVAASLKNLAFGNPAPSQDAKTVPPAKSATLGRVPSSAGKGVPPRSNIPNEWKRPPGENDYHSPAALYQPAKIPLPRGFKARDRSQPPSIPLSSKFLQWSTEYFREPQMQTDVTEEPGSKEYNERLWRRNRNDRVIAQTQPQKEFAGNCNWNRPAGLLNNGTQPMKMCLHQFEPHLVAADDRDIICVWDWTNQQRLNRFSNGNPWGSKVTEVQLINDDDLALLMTGSSDGVIKIFRDYDAPKKVELVTAFRALTDLVPSNKNAGLVFNWLQGRGMLLAAGDVKVIRVWSAASELCISDIPARSGSCVTSLTSDQVEGNIFTAGFGDGAVRVYDQRLKPATAMVRVWREHKQWITNVHLQRGGQRELVSGCRSGEVKLWDMRMDKSLATIQATKETLRSLSVHEHAPVFAAGTERHTIKVFNMNGTYLSSSEPYSSSFLHQSRSSPIATTAFHPHRMLLACAAVNETHINLFSVQDRKPEGQVEHYDKHGLF